MKNLILFLSVPAVAFRTVIRTTGLLSIVCLALLTMGLSGCKQTTTEPDKPPMVKVVNLSPTGTLGTAIVLDGSGSTDPANKALSYSWTIKSKPADSKAIITNPGSMIAGFTPDKPGTYVLVLTVTDSSNLSSSVEVTITVAIPGKPPIANAGSSSTVSTGVKVPLNGAGSSDPDGDRLTYQWTFKSKPSGSAATIANATLAVAEFTPDVLGTYVLTLSVSDGNWPTVTSDVTITVAVPLIKTTSGSWTAADGTGGGNEYTPRNHFFTLDVAGNNQPVSLSLTSSDIDVGLYMYDPNGVEVGRSGFGRSRTLDVIVNAGKYTVLVVSGQRYDIGTYVLKGRGLNSEFVRVPALREKAVDVSFGPEGGGGTDYTSRNHYYTFDVVADNAVTDINLQSPQMPLWLSLFGPAGSRLATTYVSAPAYLINKLNKGSYGLWVSSGSRDAIGKYTLDLFGQVQNLKQYVFDSSILTDAYRGKNAQTTYTLNVTDDNTILDITLRSPDGGGYINLFDPNGSRSSGTYSGSYEYLINNVSKGQYKIIVGPDGNSAGTGSYKLSVYGKFSDLKKQ